MKVIPLFFAVLLASSLSLVAESIKERVAQAQKAAVAQKKDLLLVLSASKWQKKSQEFEEKIIKSETLENGIKDHFIQVLIPCPRQRSEASKGLLELQQKYRFREMPSVVLIDAAGRPYAYTGARDLEPAAYLKQLRDFYEQRVQRDRLFAEAAQAEGLERAKLLIEGLKKMPQEMVRDFYSPQLLSIVRADKKEETTYVKEIEKTETLRKERERYGMLLRRGAYPEVIKNAQEAAAKLEGEDAQRLKLYEIQALAGLRKFEEAAKAVEEMVAMAPDSDHAKLSKQYLASLENSKRGSENSKAAAKKLAKPMVSKPIATISDINLLKKDAKEAELAAKHAVEQEEKLQKAASEMLEKIRETKAALEKLEAAHKENSATLKEASAQRERLVRRADAMKEVAENHEAMEKRKKEITNLEKKAAELQKQAAKLREKAENTQEEE